jgi:hypothetical protein
MKATGLDSRRNRIALAVTPFIGAMAAAVAIPLLFGLDPVWALVIGMVMGALGMIGSIQYHYVLETQATTRMVVKVFDEQEREWRQAMHDRHWRGGQR